MTSAIVAYVKNATSVFKFEVTVSTVPVRFGMSEELSSLDWLSTIKTSSSIENPTLIFDDSTKLCKGERSKKLSNYQQPKQTCISSSKDTTSTTTKIKNTHHPLSVSEVKSRVNSSSSNDQHSLYIRPPCSYSCLIGKAFKGSTGYLSVHEIYQFVEYVSIYTSTTFYNCV